MKALDLQSSANNGAAMGWTVLVAWARVAWHSSDLEAALRTEPHFHPLHAATARALLQRIDETP